MSTATPWYCTREDVKSALDIKETARNNAQVDRACAAAVDAVEGLTKRKFYPFSGTRYFDWPDYPHQGGRSWRLWLNQYELVSVTTLTSGSTTISSSDYFLRPDDGPPFTRLEIDRSSSASFGNSNTPQRDIAITGVFYWEDLAVAGNLAGGLDSSETDVDVTNSALVGIGDAIKCESEYMVVTSRAMLDTGRDIEVGGDMTASAGDVTVAATNATDLFVGETILIDSEWMLVVDKAGNNLTVKRAWDGSVLATHAAGASIYAPRTLTVERGALGTTAVAHNTATAISRNKPPSLIHELALAEAIVYLQQESAGFARTAGSGDNEREVAGKGVKDLRDQVYTRYARKGRTGAI